MKKAAYLGCVQRHPVPYTPGEGSREAADVLRLPRRALEHLRTTNPIEPTFATVRLRTDKTKGCGSRVATLTMAFKLAESAEKRWRRLNGHELIGDLIAGIPFTDGVKQHAA